MDRPTMQYMGTEPERAHSDDAGLDLRANEETYLDVGVHWLVGTGTRVAIPAGYVGLVCPRSGLARDWGITVLNAPGVVDSGYTGEVRVNLVNLGRSDYWIEEGERIAQLVLVPIATPELVRVDEFAATERGEGGHGSTGR